MYMVADDYLQISANVELHMRRQESLTIIEDITFLKVAHSLIWPICPCLNLRLV